MREHIGFVMSVRLFVTKVCQRNSSCVFYWITIQQSDSVGYFSNFRASWSL